MTPLSRVSPRPNGFDRGKILVIRNLLAIATNFVAVDDAETVVEISQPPK